MTIKLYGIKNCDTIKKARKWLTEHELDVQFIDHRSDGLDPSQLRAWLDELGWEALVNKRGTTYRALTEQQKANLNAETAFDLLLAEPAMIKRPLLEVDGQLVLGFNNVLYAELFGK